MHMECTASLVDDMLLVDGSNNTGVEKLNPLTVNIYDNSKWQVTTHLLLGVSAVLLLLYLRFSPEQISHRMVQV